MELIYNNDEVARCPIADTYKTFLATIVQRDYKEKYGFKDNVRAIDIDGYENSLSGENGHTIDAAIGIANYNQNHANSSRLLLVELRLDYTKKAKNSSVEDMRQKESHSRESLSASVLDTSCYFIFAENVASHKKNELSRICNSKSYIRQWKIVSPEEFNNMFCFVEDLPYEPESPINQIKETGTQLAKDFSIRELLEFLRYWMSKVENFANQYKINECKQLITALYEILILINPTKISQCSEDIQLDYMIFQEDFNRVKQWIACK